MDSFERLCAINSLDDELDYDFSVSEVSINDMEAFCQHLLTPFLDKKNLVFYRGERINSLKRPLLPTLFRDRDALMGSGEHFVDITSDLLFDYYKSKGEYISLFSSAFGYAGKYHMYDLCAFSQHYLENSPFIDFTKSLHVALSFGLKGKREFTDDAILYVLMMGDPDNYTKDIVTAECWLKDYHVRIYDCADNKDLLRNVEKTSPVARIIDIASNDRMKFQQGVFLLLDQFNLVNRLYLTKNVRSSVNIRKYILSREICPLLTEWVEKEAPWYSYSNLLDVSKGIKTAIDYQRAEL